MTRLHISRYCARGAGDHDEQLAERGVGGPLPGGGVDADVAAADPQQNRQPRLHRRGYSPAWGELL